MENEGLPDSQRPSGLCSRCGKQSSFDVGDAQVVTAREFEARYRPGHVYDYLDQVRVLHCRHCHQGTVVIEELWVGDRLGRDLPNLRTGPSFGNHVYKGFFWWPLPDTNLSSDIPSAVAADFEEAVRALYANCPRASVAMLRRALEAVCVDKGETQGYLVDRLDRLAKSGVLHPTVADWAKEVRQIGNAGAHIIPTTPVAMDDARQLHSFAREILRHIYELPAELARRRTNR